MCFSLIRLLEKFWKYFVTELELMRIGKRDAALNRDSPLWPAFGIAACPEGPLIGIIAVEHGWVP